MAFQNLENDSLDESLRLEVATMMSAENSNGTDVVEEWHFVDSSRHRPLQPVKDEPLVDTTEKLTLRSKRTERQQKKMQKKHKKSTEVQIHSFLDLPFELLMDILGCLRPSDLFLLKRVNRFAKEFIEANEHTLVDEIISMRYEILAKCFPLPVRLEDIDKNAHAALLSPRHQQRLVIHKAPYLHIFPSDSNETCSCMACVLAWNNLNLILDLAHWQKNLDEREPIPMLGRGMRPAWNIELIQTHASIVHKAMRHPLWRALILQRHLNTTVRTIMRGATLRKRKGPPTILAPSARLYQLSQDDIQRESDAFLSRRGPPSFEFPFTRDNYYMLLAYVPNRRKDTSAGGGWLYYGALHENDLAWAVKIYERERDYERLQQWGQVHGEGRRLGGNEEATEQGADINRWRNQ